MRYYCLSFTVFGIVKQLIWYVTYSMKLYDGYNQSSQEIDTSQTNFCNSPTTAPATNVHTFILNCWKEYVLEKNFWCVSNCPIREIQ